MGDNASDKEKMLRETEAMLRAVLISSPRGVRFEKLLRDYKELTFKVIPYEELGFPRLENFLQSIPSVAKVEKGPDGEWMVKGVASDADKHVAKLISKQKKPSLRKSAKSMIAKRRINPLPPKINTPARKPVQRPPAPRTSSSFELPPRMQRQKQVQSRNKVAPIGQGGVKPAQPEKGKGREEQFKKANEPVKTFENSQRRLNSVSKDTQKLSVSISNANKERKVTAASPVTSPDRPTAINVLDNAASVKWMKSVILKAQSGLWATRLEVLYKEEFKEVLPATIMEELKFRPDIVKIDEPIPGRYLLYAPKQQQPAAPNASQEDKSRVNVNSDFTLPHFLPDVGSSVVVYISETEHPGCFYVSSADAVSEKLSVEIRERYKSTRSVPEAIPSVSPGQFFCAQFTEDDNFYRACVLEVMDSKHVKILYVDFGNKEVIPVTSLRVLISDFRTQPIQAFECCLDGVQPSDRGEKWSDDAITKFDNLTSGKELKMTVLDVDDKVLSVSLVDASSELDIAGEMKKAGLAISTQNLESVSSSSSSSLSSSSGHAVLERSSSRTDTVATRSRRLKTKSPGIVELPEDQFLDVFVCNITGTYNIYLRLVGEEYSTKFEAIQESMTSYYSDSKDQVTTDPVVGELFALISDEVWCRVRVMSVNDGKIQVLFVDHGDTTETTKAELRPLAPQFTQLPFQVFQCALDGLPKTKNSDVVDKLKNLIMGEVAVAEVIKRTGDLVFIELLDTRTDAAIPVNDVVRKLVIPDEELIPVLPKVGHTADVEIAYISETGSVFLHVSTAGSNRLKELNKDLTDHYTSKRSKANEFISKPTAGKVCCAKCAEDGNWYRAKVLSFNDKDMVEVLYVDFGNTEVVPVTNLREPTQDNVHVLSLPPQALECQLYDVPKDGWNDDIIDRIFEIVEQGTLAVEVLSDGGDLPSVSLLVTEELEGKPVTHRLATLLGLAVSEDMYPDDDTQISSETDLESVSDETGEKLANMDKTGTNMEVNGLNLEMNMSNLEMKNSKEGKVSQANVDSTLVETTQQVGKREERPIATDEITPGNAMTERYANSKGGHDDSMGGAAQVVQGDDVKVAMKQWKALPLKTDWFDVYVSDVQNPENFTFQLFDNDKEICKFADELTDFYQNQAAECETTLVEGEVYAVLYDDGEWWYRGLVESVINGEKAYVRFVDYGGFATVEKDDIRVLDERFLELPFQGVQGKLTGVKHAKDKWSKQSIKSFKFLTFDRYLVARITSGHTEYDFDFKADAVSIELCDTEDPTMDIFIAKKFLELNLDVVPA